MNRMSEPATPATHPSMLARIDRWMAAHPWHPRLAPFFIWVLGTIALARGLRDVHPALYIAAYAVTSAAVVGMLWRYRRLMPELNWRFHWLVIPAGAAAAAAWMGLGHWMETMWPSFKGEPVEPYFDDMGPGLGWTAMIIRGIGMIVIVPMFEELVFRSAFLRSFHSPRDVGIALMQMLGDLPVVGDWIMSTEASRRADQVRAPMAAAFERSRVGRLSTFSIVLTLALWCGLSHLMRDWPGTFAVGFMYLAVLTWTNRSNGQQLGLGPVIWAHGLTNAIIWVYTIATGDWRFL